MVSAFLESAQSLCMILLLILRSCFHQLYMYYTSDWLNWPAFNLSLSFTCEWMKTFVFHQLCWSELMSCVFNGIILISFLLVVAPLGFINQADFGFFFFFFLGTVGIHLDWLIYWFHITPPGKGLSHRPRPSSPFSTDGSTVGTHSLGHQRATRPTRKPRSQGTTPHRRDAGADGETKN